MPQDKLMHAMVGALIVALLWPALAGGGLLVAAGAGIGKEAYDSVSGDGIVDPWDAVATGLGGLAAAVVITLQLLALGVYPWL